jgi:hypothetical protein
MEFHSVVIKTLLITTAMNGNQRMHEVTFYFSAVGMWNQLKCWVQNAIDQTFYLLLPARSYAWVGIPERTAAHLIATFPVAQIVSTVVVGCSH